MTWILRNRGALLALLVLIPLSVFVAFRAGESPPNFVDPTVHVQNDAAGVGELGGMRFWLTGAEVRTADSAELASADVVLPTGTQLVFVTVDAKPAPGAVADPERITNCVASVIGAAGTTRDGVVWDSGAAGRVGFPVGDGVPRDGCDLSDGVAASMEFSFLTPEMPVAELSLQLSSYQTVPDYLLWELPAR